LRSGRPMVINSVGHRRLIREATKDRRASLREITHNYNMASENPVSITTVSNYLSITGIHRRKAAKKPFLHPINIDERLEWCLEHANWTTEDFKKVIWSDESTVVLGQLVEDVYVWRREGERYKKECIVGTMKSGRISVMIWGCFIGNQLGPLVFREGSWNANTYIDILEENMLPLWRKLNSNKENQENESAYIFQ